MDVLDGGTGGAAVGCCGKAGVVEATELLASIATGSATRVWSLISVAEVGGGVGGPVDILRT